MENLSNLIHNSNLAIFRFFNELFSNARFDQAKVFINNAGDPHSYKYHIALICLIALFLIYCKKDNKTELKELLILGFSSVICFITSMIINLGVIIEIIKIYTAVARPYCSLDNVHVIPQTIITSPCLKSFPSGHIAFTTIIIVSFWPLFNRFFKYVALIFMTLLIISRMASGAHFPVDILGAIAICLPLTLLIRMETLKLARKLGDKIVALIL